MAPVLSPKLVRANRIAAEQDALERAHAEAITQDDAYNKRVLQEIRTCYREYVPAQFANAGRMIQAGECARLIEKANRCSKAGVPVYERIGKSRGGKSKRNLYVCNMALVARSVA